MTDAFFTTDIGKLWTKLENRHTEAVRLDTELCFKDSWNAEKRATESWSRYEETRRNFIDAIKKLMESADDRAKRADGGTRTAAQDAKV